MPCAGCGGDLCGASLADACPHCAAPVGRTVDVAAIDGATLAVVGDVTCVTCGYDVRTLRIGSRCPECGCAIVESLRPSALHVADRVWLARVRRGVTLQLVAACCVVGIVVVSWGLSSRTQATGRVGGLGLVVALCRSGIWILYGIGLFGATAPDPDVRSRDTTPAPWVARALFFSALLAVPGGGGGRLAGFVVVTVFTVIATWGTLASVPCMLVCLGRLARRARWDRLARVTAVAVRVGAGVCVVGAVLAVVSHIMVWNLRTGVGASVQRVVLMFNVVIVLYVGVGVLVFVVLVWYRRMLSCAIAGRRA